MSLLILFAVLFAVMLGYFQLADKFNIIDKPNERSSHKEITIRGGGVVFIAAALGLLVLHLETLWLPVVAFLIIGGISFLDDIYTLPNKVRIVFHLLSVAIIFYYLGLYVSFPWYMIAVFFVLVIGIINAYNFMDGINGITGLYSLIVLASLQYYNYQVQQFLEPDMIWYPIVACLVFLFFNFRTKARCFAGDVGSVTIAAWVVTLIAKAMLISGNGMFLLFLSVYGVDAILTIMHRLILRQNIFNAHRMHFYQILANDQKIPHLSVAVLYATLQLLINVYLLGSNMGLVTSFLLICLPLTVIYVILKPRLMKAKIS